MRGNHTQRQAGVSPMEPMNDTKTRLQKIDRVRKQLYAATRRLSWQNESRVWGISAKYSKRRIK